jgi:hypothetical protein
MSRRASKLESVARRASKLESVARRAPVVSMRGVQSAGDLSPLRLPPEVSAASLPAWID